ncbi:MAG: phenylalanine--tRNA ligase subunit beta [Alphaproteobacteria bacterium]|nr:phenylalanine--tRNA ligase subunit beta [Alphaproteobacteria bacterium]
MKFTLSWLKDYLETDASLADIADMLTRVGLEVESLDDRAQLAPFMIAEIKEAEPHPQAERLRVCNVFNGHETLQIVCGAPNARAGIKVVMAPIGAIIPSNKLEIKASSIRGVNSNGMLCSAAELSLGEDGDGIMELPAHAQVGQPYAAFAGLNDPVIEVAITPNRGDCLGVYGIARDLAAAGLGTLKTLSIPEISGKGSSPVNVTLNNPHCPYFIGRYFRHLTNKQSPLWMQQRLQAIGLKPLSALVDITNYIAYTYNRPLHVYDVKKLQGQLDVRLSNEGEKLTTLQHKEAILPGGLTVIADQANVQAVGGVIGSEASGCDENTTEAFLEIAYFDPAHVATSGRKLGIHTDSRYRFERNVDPVFMMDAAALTSQLILELCGGEASELVIAGTAPSRDKIIEFNMERVYSLGGVRASVEVIARIINALGFVVTDKGNGTLSLKVPTWRPDIDGEADIVEEVSRIYGYHHIEETLLPGIAERTQPVATPQQNRHWMLRHLLAARGMMEMVSWSFMSSQTAQKFHPVVPALTLRNPISADLDVMRQTIIPHMLDVMKRNHNRGFSDLALFESGPVFLAEATKQQSVMAGLRSGQHDRQQPHQGARIVDVFDAKADIFALIEASGIPTENLSVTTDTPSWYHPGRSGCIKLGKAVLGYFGEIHPAIRDAFDLPMAVVAFECILDHIPAAKVKATRTKPRLVLSEFQKVDRDFAFMLDDAISAEQLLRSVRSAEKQLITQVTIFDVYKGKGIEPGKKSVAFSVTLTPKDKTLTDQEINQVSQLIIDNVSKQCQGVLRG